MKRPPFSWTTFNKKILELKLERAKIQAKNKHADMAIKNPQWIKEAQNNRFTELTIEITKRTLAHQQGERDRRQKYASPK